VYVFTGQREIGCDTQARVRLACGQKRFQQLIVPVRRLDEDLRVAFAARACFQLHDGGGSGRLLHRQIAYETEALSVQPGSRQSQQQRRRAHERDDAYAVRMRGRDEVRAWISHCGIAGFGQQTDARTLQQRREQSGQLRGIGMLVQRADLDLRERLSHACGFQKRARALRIFCDESIESAYRREHRLGEDAGHCRLPERSRDDEQSAEAQAGLTVAKMSTPN